MEPNLETALDAARRAVYFDKNEQYKQSVYYYSIAIQLLKNLSAVPILAEKCAEYQNRIIEIQQTILDEERKTNELRTPIESELQRCKFLLNQALDADEAGFKEEAIKLYTNAAELGLKAKVKSNEKTKITNLVCHALDRAESLKKIKTNETDAILSNLPSVPDTDLSTDNLLSETKSSFTSEPTSTNPSLYRDNSAHLKITGGNNNYTEEEKKVLLYTSHINNHEFVPFMKVDLLERFQYAIPFTDKDGFLKLSPKQKPDFDRWCRPEDIFSEPKMVMGNGVDYYNIKQTVVSDCSLVASLAVSAQYEKKFGRKLITSIIYPKNKNKEPIYNPFGKYMIKLHINGIPRKVVIDDLLPVSRDNKLLCSYSNNRGELWISLIEKAYMKVMGGYDFPGSNSNIDLHALTGWIPERWAIRPSELDFKKDELFETILLRLHKGDALITVSTGELSNADAERTGLVPTHAYAVLDVRKIHGEKLLKLKNPWSHLRWRGNYSELDMKHWTPTLREALNYDPDSASHFDNGIFWIDFESICHFFDVFCFNWNPELFNYTYCIHQMWKSGTGPIKDSFNIGDNPQFSLEIQGDAAGSVWILLTRHIMDIADFRENQEYITVLVYKNNGKRVYYRCKYNQ